MYVTVGPILLHVFYFCSIGAVMVHDCTVQIIEKVQVSRVNEMG